MSGIQNITAFVKRHSTLPVLMVPIIIAGILISLFGSRLLIDVFTFFCISLSLALGAQMIIGNGGVLAWTHVGFVGIGAYVTGILVTPVSVKEMGVPNMYPFLVDLQMPVLPSIVVAGLVAAAIAAVIAYPLMRLNDFASVITLFATLVVIHVVMTQWDNVTNGPRTFFGLPQWTTLTIALIAAMLAIAVAYYFRESGLGLKLRATRDDRHAAAAIGINMINVRYLGFILSALVAGVSGGLWALYITSFSPKAFYMAEMFMLLAMLVIGGAGSVSGATAGAVVVSVARELLRQTESTINNAHVLPFEVYGLAQLVMAVLLVVVLIWRPSGVIGGQELRWPLFKRKDRAEDAAEQKLAA
ncbi:MAG TPA: branched-chain amino acid ABC transporter permease [Coriobacteriia bacterium]|uniref:branched-chain amino acid ABC transporter permease n=1 Tax=Anaerosoma tenue TaxID=2933588 RepID=UPI00076BCFA5|nr:branched-chain amino acid ABC transporter permease [Anaerosoma tenue]KUK47476.1 MAG: ABC-type transporter, integral membrane subunit [Actinobacteria bacterium 66_15]MCK8114096.1 branched-chain amino acid ABC transporter permease [Anaerosoma tenue]HAL31307.1 branched-chain amino acid ABC transporter permease [Coriobacteriia bacterium]